MRDAHGRTTEVGLTQPGQAREVVLTAAGYHPFGPVAEWVFGNGRLFQRTLNQNYQAGVIQDQGSGGLSLGYEFDAVGNLLKLRNGSQGEPPLQWRKHVFEVCTDKCGNTTRTPVTIFSGEDEVLVKYFNLYWRDEHMSPVTK